MERGSAMDGRKRRGTRGNRELGLVEVVGSYRVSQNQARGEFRGRK